jgi:hypothetical protein
MIDFNFALITLYPNIALTEDKKAYDANGNEVIYDKQAVQAYVDANKYKDQRATAYPSIQEQLDMQYWDSVNGTTTWADAIAAVKQEFPKP